MNHTRTVPGPLAIISGTAASADTIGTSTTTSGTFVHQSVAASRPHDPLVTLASHTIRTILGRTVQTIADCLQCRGPLTLTSLRKYLPSVVTISQIRASLLVLLQHGLVTVAANVVPSSLTMTYNAKNQKVFLYTYHVAPAIHMLRYPRFIEYIRKAVDITSACLVEELLLHGRLRTVDLTLAAMERYTILSETEDITKIATTTESTATTTTTTRQCVLDAFCKLVRGGYIQQIRHSLKDADKEQDNNEFGENEFDEVLPPPPSNKRVKMENHNSIEDEDIRDISSSNNNHRNSNLAAVTADEDPAIVVLLNSHSKYKETLPVDALWRVSVAVFHEHLRAYYLGKLIAERHGARVQSAGSLVTAALRYRAQQKYGLRNQQLYQQQQQYIDYESFTAQDTIKYLPEPVVKLFENKTGGLLYNLNKAWCSLSELTAPPHTVRRIQQDRYEMIVPSMVKYLQDRIIYQIVHDRHGEVAARVVSILKTKGYLESEPLGDIAMVPARDTREVLHNLFKSRYIELLQLSGSSSGGGSSSKYYSQYNPATIIYLWGVEAPRLLKKISHNVAHALWNISLRRSHELIVHQDHDEEDDNNNNSDEANSLFVKFQLGLERLDVAALQLDETLMALSDF